MKIRIIDGVPCYIGARGVSKLWSKNGRMFVSCRGKVYPSGEWVECEGMFFWNNARRVVDFITPIAIFTVAVPVDCCDISKTEGDGKFVCSKLMLLDVIDTNKGEYNVGHFNIGNCNMGNCNIGNLNNGSHNKGDRNNGFYNDGSCNNGDYNNGDNNNGDDNDNCIIKKCGNVPMSFEEWQQSVYGLVDRLENENQFTEEIVLDIAKLSWDAATIAITREKLK
jgi:hypothetical protein